MKKNSNMKPIPEYEGQNCTSNCRREGCEHAENFAEKKLEVEHDNETRHYEVVWKDKEPMLQVEKNIWLK